MNGSSPISNGTAKADFKVSVSFRFLLLSITSSILAAFAIGQLVRHLVVEPHRILFKQLASEHASLKLEMAKSNVGDEQGYLPPPIIPAGKEIPRTVYTSKNFDTARTATSSSLLIQSGSSNSLNDVEHDSAKALDSKDSCDAAVHDEDDDDEDNDDDDEGEYLPAGQHLLVDMKHLSAAFLNSEERLARAMVELVNQAQLTLLSYHCHSLVPSGVSCVGVLLESHVSFHTWPEHGVITLDLFTCGSNPLLPVVDIIKRLFGVPREGSLELPETRWSHTLRGFGREDDRMATFDLGRDLLGDLSLELKEEVASIETKYQHIDIYDILDSNRGRLSRYERSRTEYGSYYAEHPEFFSPDRKVFLNGVLQSRKQGEAAYHESLVQPAMVTHPNPKRAAIVGGGEGATLREVLKHNTIEYVKMIDIDEEMVRASRQYIPSWSDCSDLVGSADWCVDDPRASVEFIDGLAWFMERYGSSAGEQFDSENKFDVIIMDALDPQDDIPFTKQLYADVDFIQSLYNALTDDGIYVVQVGFPPEDIPEAYGKHTNRHVLVRLLEQVGFSSIHVYGEPHSFFTEEWYYLLAMKSESTRVNFFRNAAEIELELVRRLRRTKSGDSPLDYFDGATMNYYRVPGNDFVDVYCIDSPTPDSCARFQELLWVPSSAAEENILEVTSGPYGFSVTSKVDIPARTRLGYETTSNGVALRSQTLAVLEAFRRNSKKGEVLSRWLERFGNNPLTDFGATEIIVQAGLMMLLECNSTTRAKRNSFYDPVLDTEMNGLSHSVAVVVADIKAGEKISCESTVSLGAADSSMVPATMDFRLFL